MLRLSIRTSLVSILGLLFIGAANAAVTGFFFTKGKGGDQITDNATPAISHYFVDIDVETDNAGDATSVTVSGGGISGSIAFTQDGTEWYTENNYDTEAEQDAEFPSDATYTITLSGGTLGLLTQDVTLGPKAYPDFPTLTGTKLTDAKSVDANSDFTLTYAPAGGNGTVTEIEIGDGIFDIALPNLETSQVIASGTLDVGSSNVAFVDHFNEEVASGAGGFGADGLVGYDIFNRFFINTNGGVTEWFLAKSKGGQQGADDTTPAITFYDVDSDIQTSSVGDATSVTISGGGIAGSLAYTQDGTEWFLENSYASEAAMNAEFPSNTTYTITLSGGTLGTLTQDLTLGSNDYPDFPILTGTSFTEIQSLDPTADLTVNIAAPGGFGNLTIFEVGDDFFVDLPGGATSAVIPVNTIAAGTTHETYAEHANAQTVSGNGGFGADGQIGHTTFNQVQATAASSGTPRVISWDFIKGNGGAQTADNTVPPITFYDVECEIETANPGDATAVSITGGGIVGSIAFTQEDNEWYFDRNYNTEAEQDAEFPSNAAYTITLSGGTLGTLVQNITLGAKEYPEFPQLTGTKFTDIQSLDSTADFLLTFGAAGSFGRITEFEIDDVFEVDILGTGTSVTIPAGTIDPGVTQTAYLDHFNDPVFSGTDGFGVDGFVGHNVFNQLEFTTLSGAAGGVEFWKFIKGKGGIQTADNTPPAIDGFHVDLLVETEFGSDAQSVSISGGGIAGSLGFDQEGSEWFLELDFDSEAELDAMFPSGTTYTITLSGGTLGTLVQDVDLGSKAYPNTPYLTGTKYSELGALDPDADFTVTFSDPGSLTDASGRTILEVFDEFDEEDFLRDETSGSTTAASIPVGTLHKSAKFLGFLEYTNAQAMSGTNGFGIDGTVSHNIAVDFRIETLLSPLVGAWQFGDGAANASGVLVFLPNGYYFHAEDAEVGSSDPDGMERGTYTWNESTGAFSATTVVDTNGEIGLSHPDGSDTFTVVGDSLTVADSQDSTVLTRVGSGSDPLVGAWTFGDASSFDSGVLVFLDNGIYFHAEDIEENDQFESDGIERGTFDWNDTTGALTATVELDTNGEIGASHPIGGFILAVTGDVLNISDDLDSTVLRRVGPASVGASGGVMDAGLEQAIRDAIGKPSGELTVGDMQELTSLTAVGLSISDLTGLGNATNLDELNLSHNQISDLTALSLLTGLTSLNLANNLIDNLEPLGGLVYLEFLDVSGNLLEDPAPASESGGGIQVQSSAQAEFGGVLDPLGGLTNLNTLLLADNKIRILEPLGTLSGLEEVDVSNNDVTDLAPLAALEELEEVALYGNPVDLTQGSAQSTILEQITTNTGAIVVLVDPNPNNLRQTLDTVTGRLELEWPTGWVLESSTDLSTWTDVNGAQSPLLLPAESTLPTFWRIREVTP